MEIASKERVYAIEAGLAVHANKLCVRMDAQVMERAMARAACAMLDFLVQLARFVRIRFSFANLHATQFHPAFCSGVVSLSSSAGAISDHGAGRTYAANSDCTWLINAGGPATLSFSNEVQTSDGFADVLSVSYTLNSTTRNISLSQSRLLMFPINSDDGVFVVRFTSDASQQRSGFKAEWSALSACPASCSNHGSCVKGTCVCHGAYSGSDCSASTTLPSVGGSASLVANRWKCFDHTSSQQSAEILLFAYRRGDTGAPLMCAACDAYPSGEDCPYLAVEADFGTSLISITLPGSTCASGKWGLCVFAGLYPSQINVTSRYDCAPGCFGNCTNAQCVCDPSCFDQGSCSAPLLNCTNGGSCSVGQCSCLPGYYGDFCESTDVQISGGGIAGIVMTCLAFLIVTAVGVYFLLKYQNKKKEELEMELVKHADAE
jgi:hypothetical protein